MRYQAMALFAEGPTDHRFLSPLLRRCGVELCRKAVDEVEIGEVIALYPGAGDRDEPRQVQILNAAREAIDGFDILFVHGDGGGDPPVRRAQAVSPGVEAVLRELGPSRRHAVGVVPVREMEAWALVDGEAIRQAFGTTLTDDQLPLPRRAREVEGILDPKKLLADAYETVVGRRRRRGRGAEVHLARLGELVRLERLRQVPAFQELERDFLDALRFLGYLRGER